MRKFLWVLLALFSARLPAQTYQYVNFQTFTGAFSSGFSATLLMRNEGGENGRAYVLGPPSVIGVSARVQAACLAKASSCVLGGGPSHPVGPLQVASFRVGDDLWVGGQIFSELGCGGNFCFALRYETFGGGGILGCTLPAGTPFSLYVARTCDAEGYTGAVAINVSFAYHGSDAASIALTTADLSGPSGAVFVTPEPATRAMLLVGLGCLGVVRCRSIFNRARNV
ncbi:MAG: hypothetical protein ABI120_13340 [Gemmatimonadaceae bacterium]